jgi:hypothetical protein
MEMKEGCLWPSASSLTLPCPSSFRVLAITLHLLIAGWSLRHPHTRSPRGLTPHSSVHHIGSLTMPSLAVPSVAVATVPIVGIHFVAFPSFALRHPGSWYSAFLHRSPTASFAPHYSIDVCLNPIILRGPSFISHFPALRCFDSLRPSSSSHPSDWYIWLCSRPSTGHPHISTLSKFLNTRWGRERHTTRQTLVSILGIIKVGLAYRNIIEDIMSLTHTETCLLDRQNHTALLLFTWPINCVD